MLIKIILLIFNLFRLTKGVFNNLKLFIIIIIKNFILNLIYLTFINIRIIINRITRLIKNIK